MKRLAKLFCWCSKIQNAYQNDHFQKLLIPTWCLSRFGVFVNEMNLQHSVLMPRKSTAWIILHTPALLNPCNCLYSYSSILSWRIPIAEFIYYHSAELREEGGGEGEGRGEGKVTPPLANSRLSKDIDITRFHVQLQDSKLLQCTILQMAPRTFLKTKGPSNSTCLGMTDLHVKKV